MKKKWVQAHRPAIETLYEHVGQLAYETLLVHELPAGIISPKLGDKVACVAVITSGSADPPRDWMAVVPLRVDTSGSQGDGSEPAFVYDKDPMTFYLSKDGVPGVSGSVSFHANYPGRTEDAPVAGGPRNIKEAVAEIRSRFNATSGSLGEAKESLQNALQYGVTLFRKMEDDLDDPGIPIFERDSGDTSGEATEDPADGS